MSGDASVACLSRLSITDGSIRSTIAEVPCGSGYDSQSVLNNLFPQVYGHLAAGGSGKRLAFVVSHPTSNSVAHYLTGPLQRRVG
jgi:hypothetical protein